MSQHRLKAAVAASLMSCAILAAPVIASACCPSDGNTTPKSSQGLGQSFPQSIDLSTDPLYQVYKFERDGVQYLQINDAAGVVRAAIGRIGDTLWVLPVGADADRVDVPGTPTLAIGSGVVIYRGTGVEIRKYQGASGETWSINPEAP